MDSKHLFAMAAGFFSVAYVIPYLIGIARKECRPHGFTWGLWSLTTWIAFAAQITSGAGVGAWGTAIGALGCSVVTLLSIWVGEKKITRSDWIICAAVLAAIPLWIFTKSPLASVILISIIDNVAAYPTLRKSWGDPFSENIPAYLIGIASEISILFALADYSPVNWLYPVAIIFCNSCIVGVLLYRRWALKH